MWKTISLMLASLFIFTFFIACDSNKTAEDEPDDDGYADVFGSVITNVGPVEKVVTADVLNILQETDRLLYWYSLKARGQEGSDCEKSADCTKAKFDGGCLVDSSDDSFSCNLDLSVYDADCGGSGSKSVSSNLTLMLDEGGQTGHFLGSFSIEYSTDCQVEPTMTVADGATCQATAAVDGSITTTVSTFTFSAVEPDSEDFDTIIKATADNTDGAFAVAVGSVSSSQGFSFSYDMSYQTGSTTGLDGYVTFGETDFGVSALETAVGATTISVACP